MEFIIEEDSTVKKLFDNYINNLFVDIEGNKLSFEKEEEGIVLIKSDSFETFYIEVKILEKYKKGEITFDNIEQYLKLYSEYEKKVISNPDGANFFDKIIESYKRIQKSIMDKKTNLEKF